MGALYMRRRTHRVLIAVATVAALFPVMGSPPATATEELRSANLAEVRDGIRINWLTGHAVINDQNEKIGTISEFVVGRDFAVFAILQTGEFLALDTYLVAVPFKTLVIDKQQSRIRLPGATRKALRNFPEFRFIS
jgi:PRC-barrel domain protein